MQTPNDFQGYDRRFIWNGLYIDALVGESVQVYVAIDTSGSISDQEMNLSGNRELIKKILDFYPLEKRISDYSNSKNRLK